MLQTSFLDEGTPFHFVICNAPTEENTTLLDNCSSPLSKAALNDIEAACCKRSDDKLYQLIMAHPHLRPSSQEYGLPTAHPSSGWIYFTVPNYPERMIMAHDFSLKAIVSSAFLGCLCVMLLLTIHNQLLCGKCDLTTSPPETGALQSSLKILG